MFDIKTTIAEMQTNTTDAYRDLYPQLRNVWDELDELREMRDSDAYVPKEDYDALEDELSEAESDRDDLQNQIAIAENNEMYIESVLAKTANACVDVSRRLARIVEKLPDGPLRDQLDDLWCDIPEPR